MPQLLPLRRQRIVLRNTSDANPNINKHSVNFDRRAKSNRRRKSKLGGTQEDEVEDAAAMAAAMRVEEDHTAIILYAESEIPEMGVDEDST